MPRAGMKRLTGAGQASLGHADPAWPNQFEAQLDVRREGEERRFASTREAKEFLIDWIVAEARRLDLPLSEVERKMLYAAENGWTLPDMAEVQEAFDSYHEAVEYELKVVHLIRIVRAGVWARGGEEFDAWNEAVRVLSRERHYLSELIAASEGPIRRRTSRWKMWAMVLLILGISFALAYWVGRR